MPFTFTNRIGGVSEAPFDSNNLALHVGDFEPLVISNRKKLSDELGMPIVFMDQFHSDKIVRVDSNEVTHKCDSIITTEAKLALAVLVADCIPLLLKSDVAIAAVHVGRAGLMNEIALKTIAEMENLGAERISGYIGPSICGDCYEVSQEIHNEVVIKYPNSDTYQKTGKYTLDLVAGLKSQLRNVLIHDHGSCVLEDSNFYSYRRSGTTGRQAGVIWR
jgi:YfiH family protein